MYLKDSCGTTANSAHQSARRLSALQASDRAGDSGCELPSLHDSRPFANATLSEKRQHSDSRQQARLYRSHLPLLQDGGAGRRAQLQCRTRSCRPFISLIIITHQNVDRPAVLISPSQTAASASTSPKSTGTPGYQPSMDAWCPASTHAMSLPMGLLE